MNKILAISKTDNGDCIILTDIQETEINHSYVELSDHEVSVVFNKKSIARGSFSETEIRYIKKSQKIVLVTSMTNPKYKSFFTYLS